MQDSESSLGPNESGHEPRLKPLFLTAEQAGSSLAICRTKVYELLRTGELESIQMGPAVEFRRQLSRRTSSGSRKIAACDWIWDPPRRPFPTNHGFAEQRSGRVISSGVQSSDRASKNQVRPSV